jgi:PAP2 superfamily
MHYRTKALVAVAAVAIGAGIAIPVFGGMSSYTEPAATLADTPGSGHSVIEWNRQLISILGTPNAQPATVHPTRSFAMLQAAEYDAVVSITHATPPYRASVPAPGDARPDAAADQAAHDVLVALYPTMRTGLDAQLSGELAAMPDGQARQDGVGVGAAAAHQLIALRSSDSSSAAAPPFVAGTRPGDYRQTPPKFPAPMYTGWGSVTPFLLGDAKRFRPAPPPPVSSATYASALNEVKSLGRDSSTTRTTDETVAGKFWSATPVWNTWNQVAQQLTADRHATLTQATGVFSALDLSLADTTIALYDAKYHYNIWRPVTAIQLGDTAGNPSIVGDPTWNALTPTAADPSYAGAHSALSEAAATAMTAFYGPQQAVTITSSAGTRSFASLSSAANEAGLSRIWSGQHTRLDHEAGQRLGSQVADVVLGDLSVHRPDAG